MNRIDFTGWTLLGRPPYTDLRVLTVGGDGQFDGSLSGNGASIDISGKYDAGSGGLSFNDSQNPELSHFPQAPGVTFFDGQALPTAGNEAPSFSGTWTEVVWTKLEVPQDPNKKGVRGSIRVDRFKGMWAAVNPQPIIA